MIVLDFVRDEHQLEVTRQEYRPDRGGNLSSWWFLQPITFTVSGIDMLPPPPGQPGRLVTLLQVVRALDGAVNRVAAGRTDEWDADGAMRGHLTFEPAGGQDVKVSSSETGAVAIAPIAELREAVTAFAERARRYMIEELPEVVNDEKWGWWFRQEPEPP